MNGAADVQRAAADLAGILPEELAPLAHIAYDYRWSWTPGGPELFRSIDPDRWEMSAENPVRLLNDASPGCLRAAAGNEGLVARGRALLETLTADRERPPLVGSATADRPVTFLCAEFAVHRSLPIYAGGLGVLAGDILKEASDLAIPMVAVGLLYRQGYFLQRVDSTGYQHEYWSPVDPDMIPAALVRAPGGGPLTVSVPVRGRDVVIQVWRVDVGRVPLYLLDAERVENSPVDRWVTSRLYVGDRATRLAQYALLGVGSMRALEAMGMDPAVVHLNEGHAALAPLEIARRRIVAGASRDDAVEEVRRRTVFTTHTPVRAGNEGYDVDEVMDVVGELPRQLGMNAEEFLNLGRMSRGDAKEQFVMTPLGIRISRAANGVSRIHGGVSRSMWQPLFPGRAVQDVPIGHVTNGVHLPTWMAPPMRALLDGHLGPGWEERADDPSTWLGVDGIPDEELWRVRCEMREYFAAFTRERTIANRLARSDPPDYAQAAERGFDSGTLTIGFARRLATYKRLHLLTVDAHRIVRLVEDAERPIQLVVAGKAHPQDEDGKRSAQGLFAVKRTGRVAERVSFIDNYDLSVAAPMVAGCDLWVNVPRPPLEASGTSGMKSVLNGGLNLSVLDGWWAEAYDGGNGWAVEAGDAVDAAVQDSRDAAAVYDLLEREVIPLFYDRDAAGIPRGWIARMRASLKTNGPRFTATRMVRDYLHSAYKLDS
ncbi:MAG: alpha-glucan family phosphorylase [Candidatus Dormibacteria bacterium]